MRIGRSLRRAPLTGAAAAVLGMVTLGAVFAPVLTPYGPAQVSVGLPLDPPGRTHLFGTDRFGRDVFSRVLAGGRLSLPVGILAVSLSLAVGSLWGLVTGFLGGRVDAVGGRSMDILLGIPPIMLALLVVAVLGIGIHNVVLAVGIAGIPRFARIVRGATLSVRESGYIDAVRATGAPSTRILFRHVLPNVLAPIIVIGTLQSGSAILETASLGFLGLGVQPPAAEWGTMLSEGREFMRRAPWLMVCPGGVLFLTVLSTNLIGDYVREALDPRLRNR
jgi:ABC-type dipeptide/oligopeptide/nickel transport system permease subunit